MDSQPTHWPSKSNSPLAPDGLPTAAQTWGLRCVLGVAVLSALLIGLNVRNIYDWTGEDQSRHSVWTDVVVFSIVGTALVLSITLPWIPLPKRTSSIPWRFGIGTLAMLTGVIAVLLVAIQIAPLVLSGILCVAAYCFAFYCTWRWRDSSVCLYGIPAMLFSILVPFLWIVRESDKFDLLALVLRWLGQFPAFLPAVVGSGLMGSNTHSNESLAVILTAFEIVVGVFAFRIGPRIGILYLIWSTVAAIIGAFVLHALIRA